jgi:hypothetical protein
MAATLEIQELPEGLSIHVTEPRRTGRIVLTITVGALATAFFVYAASPSKLYQLFVGLLCAIALIRDLIKNWRGTKVELRLTNLDFISRGRAPDGYGASSIPRAAIYNLEFRKASGGGEDAEYPSGLYIEHHGVLHNPSTCVLPHIDNTQTDQVIEAIMRRFPDTGTLPPTGPFEPYLTSLNLNR